MMISSIFITLIYYRSVISISCTFSMFFFSKSSNPDRRLPLVFFLSVHCLAGKCWKKTWSLSSFSVFNALASVTWEGKSGIAVCMWCTAKSWVCSDIVQTFNQESDVCLAPLFHRQASWQRQTSSLGASVASDQCPLIFVVLTFVLRFFLRFAIAPST